MPSTSDTGGSKVVQLHGASSSNATADEMQTPTSHLVDIGYFDCSEIAEIERNTEDPAFERRKRIKRSISHENIQSSDSLGSPKQQSEDVGQETKPAAVENIEANAISETTATDQSSYLPSTPPQNKIDDFEVDNSGSRAYGMHNLQSEGTEISSNSSELQNENNESKPKKMLRLRPNGKFSSPPKPSLPVQPKKTQRGRRRKERQLMVTLKYPNGTDRLQFGQKIERILDSAEGAKEQIPGQETIKDTSRQIPIQPTGSPKPTHPFFLGKASRPSLPAQPEHSTSPANQPPHRSPLRRRATATPVKPKVRFDLPYATAESPRTRTTTSTRSGFGFIKYPGASDAPWPNSLNKHVRDEKNDNIPLPVHFHDPILDENGKKTMGNVIIPPSESIVFQNTHGLDLKFNKRICDILDRYSSEDRNDAPLRKPRRTLLSAYEIQRQVSTELSIPIEEADHKTSSNLPRGSSRLHKLLQKAYCSIQDYVSPFDKFECETQLWTQKYSPQKAEEVLQQGPEVIVIREWLQQCTVESVNTGSKGSTASFDLSNKTVKVTKKRKRRREEDLDDFIVSSDDENRELGELSELDIDDTPCSGSTPSRSLVRGGTGGLQPGKLSKVGNVILLSGPHGCGKTASVYAVAKELGFEIFELNSGSRRSGKDVLDKIGDMAENHLVQQVAKVLSDSKTESDMKLVDEIPMEMVPDHRQKSMASFFKPIGDKKNGVKDSKLKPATIKKEPKPSGTRPHQRQKQSLILLEEVDVLFEEDKQFWLTVLTLATNSKRPIILTCNDENLVPINALMLHAILRFTAPPIDIVVDYLLLLAAREGHLLKRDAVQTLYEAKGHDLRASILELNFWCQMGVGATNCLEWLFQRWPPGSDVDDEGRTLRVTSNGTYDSGMGFFGYDLLYSSQQQDVLSLALQEAQKEWDICDDDLKHFSQPLTNSNFEDSSPTTLLDTSFRADCRSAADVYAGLEEYFNLMKQKVDASLPGLSDKAKLNYTIGYPVLETDGSPGYSDIGESLVSSSLALARPDLMMDAATITVPNALERSLMDVILAAKARHSRNEHLTRSDFVVFDLLAEPSSSQQTTSFSTSSFDREFAVITTDLAPYVRSIAAYDLQLEAERLKLSNILSAGGIAKRLRTTRAARSALEGGKRESTRRERWFDKNLNLQLVMETRGKTWAAIETHGEQKLLDEDVSVVSSAQTPETAPSPES